MPDMGKRFSHHTNRENPLTQNPDTAGSVIEKYVYLCIIHI